MTPEEFPIWAYHKIHSIPKEKRTNTALKNSGINRKMRRAFFASKEIRSFLDKKVKDV